MECPKCQSDNPDTKTFCGDCGAQLPVSEEIPVPTQTIEVPKKELTTGSTFVGRYQIIEELGKGGMGKVYKVLDNETNEKIALKLIKPEIASDKKTIERFRNELTTTRKISQKNVCRMFDLNREEGNYYITMEYVPGGDLKKLIRRTKQLTAGTAISIAKQICDGLAEAHNLGIVHRDLKPSNVMIDDNGNARIMDFGIARTVKGKGITGSGVMIGTPEYMSPEQVEAKDVDQRSDIYSLGVILYEMITGRLPFEGDTPLAVAMKHKGEVPQDPAELNPQVPEDLSRVILTCLEKAKDKRYQSASELSSELENIEKGLPTTDRVIPKRKPTSSKEITVTFKKRWVLIVSPFVIILVAALAYFFSRIGKEVISRENMMLVVIPFDNLGPPEDEYFANGITGDIRNRLSVLPGLEVISSTSANQYKKTEKSMRQIREELDVDYVVTGTVRWDKNEGERGRVLVSPLLIKALDDTQIWSEDYVESIEDIFGVQARISEEIVRQLDITLLDPDRQALEAKPTDNLEAYDFYLRGNNYLRFGLTSPDNIRTGIDMFEKAVSLDPQFALAHARLAFARAYLYWGGGPDNELAAGAKAAVERAFQINPDLPEAYEALGLFYYYVKWDFAAALEQFIIAQKRLPSNSRVYSSISGIERRQDKWKQSAINSKKAVELDPRSAPLAYNHALTLLWLREYSEAEHYINLAISLDPDTGLYIGTKVELYLMGEGNTNKARATVDEASKNQKLSDAGFNVRWWIQLDILDGNYQEALDRLSQTSEGIFSPVNKDLRYAGIYRLMNQRKLAQEYYDSARIVLESRIKENPDQAERPYALSGLYSRVSQAYAGLGRKQDAISWAEKAVEINPESYDALNGRFPVMRLAGIYVMVGEYDLALDKIEYLLSVPSQMSVPLLKLNPFWKPLHDHPRFKQLLEKYSK